MEDEEKQKGGDRKERGSLRLTARGCLSLAGRMEEGARHLPTPEIEVSQPPLLGPWGSTCEPAAAGRWFLDSGPLAPASVYFWCHS